jgi:hypothetical protein
MLAVVVMLALALGGCLEYGYKMNELYGLNCRPEALQDGKCVATNSATKEAKK